MDWIALSLSLKLAALTGLILLPLGIAAGRWLAYARFPGKSLVEAIIALPLVLPPTVLGFYLLSAMGAGSALGELWRNLFGSTLVFSFEGILLVSIIANIPFAIQPVQRSFEAIPPDLREAAAACGMPPLAAFLRVEAPLAWPGVLTAGILCFAHTLGEFGAVLMVGGAIPGETRTLAIAIYDRVQAFDDAGAGMMSAILLGIAMLCMGLTFFMSQFLPGLGGRK
jgi:molybdate transport system permease protein